MTKTEANIISTAARGGEIFLAAREKAALIKLLDQVRVLKATHHKGNVVKVFFDNTCYLGQEPEEFLTVDQIRGKY